MSKSKYQEHSESKEQELLEKYQRHDTIGDHVKNQESNIENFVDFNNYKPHQDPEVIKRIIK